MVMIIEYLFLVVVFCTLWSVVRSQNIENNKLKDKYRKEALKDKRIFRAICLQRFENLGL